MAVRPNYSRAGSFGRAWRSGHHGDVVAAHVGQLWPVDSSQPGHRSAGSTAAGSNRHPIRRASGGSASLTGGGRPRRATHALSSGRRLRRGATTKSARRSRVSPAGGAGHRRRRARPPWPGQPRRAAPVRAPGHPPRPGARPSTSGIAGRARACGNIRSGVRCWTTLYIGNCRTGEGVVREIPRQMARMRATLEGYADHADGWNAASAR